MKKILVVGCLGMAGHVLKAYLESLKIYEVWGIARNASTTNNCIVLDVSKETELQKILKKYQFDVVVNCIGILNKNAEDHADKAVWFNSYFPHLLERWGKEYTFKLIHISTDCVFSGKGAGGYTENSFKDGIGFYAQSKALGEVINHKDLTFRTSIIGPELKADGIGLFHWFMHQPENNVLHGFTAAYWTGVTTIVLAKAIHQAVQENLSGLYHLVYPEKISKYDLVGIFNTAFRADRINIVADHAYKVDKSLLNTRTDFGFVVPDYKAMVGEMKNWIKDQPDLYANNYTSE